MKISTTILVCLMAVVFVACGGTSGHNTGYSTYGNSMYYNGANYGTYAPGVGYNINNMGSVSQLSEMVISSLYSSGLITTSPPTARLPDYVMVGTPINSYTVRAEVGGTMLGGTISDVFVGINAFEDLLIVAKITNGAQVVGYNIILSFCLKSPVNTNTVIQNFGQNIGGFIQPVQIQLLANATGGFGGAVAINTSTIIVNPTMSVPNSFHSIF